MRRGVASLSWFLFAHRNKLSQDLLLALNDGEVADQPIGEVVRAISDLSREQVGQLSDAIIGGHREYFGTMNGRELASFIQDLTQWDSPSN